MNWRAVGSAIFVSCPQCAQKTSPAASACAQLRQAWASAGGTGAPAVTGRCSARRARENWRCAPGTRDERSSSWHAPAVAHHERVDAGEDAAQDVDLLALEARAREEAPQPRHQPARTARVEEADVRERARGVRVQALDF